jgi:hypothetical protein
LEFKSPAFKFTKKISKMKKTLLITLLLIPLWGISQTTKEVEGFLGIKFGSSSATVQSALNAKGGILDKKNTDAELMTYTNIKLGHRDAGLFVVKFINDKAFEADFIFAPGLDAKTLDYYYSLVDDINDNYGKGESTATFKSPYSDKDPDDEKILAIKNAEGEYRSFWQSSNTNTISITITEELAVILKYQDTILVHEAIDKQKAKEKSDY